MREPTPKELRSQVGKRLRLARRAAGFRFAKEFADILDIDQNSYTPYERGAAYPPAHVLARVKQLTGVTMDWLFLAETSNLPVRVLQALEQEASVMGVRLDGTPVKP